MLGVPSRMPFWKNAVLCKVLDNNLIKTSPTSNWDGGAFGTEAFIGNCYVEFSCGSPLGEVICGFSRTDTNQSYDTIDFAIYCAAAANLVNKIESGVPVSLGTTWAVGDLFRVQKVGSTISYWKNGVSLGNSAGTPGSILYVDTSMYYSGTIIANVRAQRF